MRLTLHNRSRQHAELHITPPLRDGKPMMAPLISVDASATATVDGSAAEISAILDNLQRFGVKPRREADHFDAVRAARHPAWKGITYEVTGDA